MNKVAEITAFEKAKMKISEKQPHLNLVEFSDIYSVAKFIDNKYGEFHGLYRSVLYGSKKHLLRKKLRASVNLLTFLDAQKQLNEKQPHLILLEYNGTTKPGSFTDTEYGNFTAIFKYVRDGEVNHKERSRINKLKAVTSQSKIDKYKQTCLKKYGVSSYTKTKEFKEKASKTNIEKYGTAHHNELTFELAKVKLLKNNIPYKLLQFNGPVSQATFLDDQYGEFTGIFDYVCYGDKKHPERASFNIKSASQDPQRYEKIKQTNLKKYGHISPLSSADIKDKIKKTNLKKYGVEHVFSSTYIKDKIKDTNLKKYGVENVFSSTDAKEKIRETKIKKGSIRLIDEQTVKEYIKSANKGLSESHSNYLIRKHGLNIIRNYEKQISSIETLICNILDRYYIKYNQNAYININNKKHFADILIEEHKLIIECDGLYFHGDLKQDNNKYHKQKQANYLQAGYRSLFFREDEINNKYNIVESVILAKLNIINSKIFARKCKIQELGSKESGIFFKENHLMGKGSGKTYTLVYDDCIVSAIRVINKKKHIEISRFCNKLHTQVLGGLGKLLKHIFNTYHKDIISFVDMRYGDGHSLIKLGFEEVANHISFKWVLGHDTVHRMRFKGNSGYESKSYKIWDCGQKKFKKCLKS